MVASAPSRRDPYAKALRSPALRQRKVKPKRGAGSYKRTPKHKEIEA